MCIRDSRLARRRRGPDVLVVEEDAVLFAHDEVEVEVAVQVAERGRAAATRPSSQRGHAELAGAEYVPAKQAVDAEAPVLSTKLPASASLQSLEPSSSAYLATSQSTHAPAPAPLYVPTGHASHSLAPSAALEYPLEHSVHVSLPSTL